MRLKNLKSATLWMLALMMPGTMAMAQTPVDIPTTSGSYIDWNNASGSNYKVENSGANIGSTRGNTVVNFTINNTTAQSYVLSFTTGAQTAATLDLTLTDASSNSYLDADVTVSATGAWSLTEPHAYFIENLPEGMYTLTFAVTNATGSYAGNWGQLAFTPASEFDSAPGSITATNGSYGGGARCGDDGNVGYITDGAYGTYTFICSEAGFYELSIAMQRHNDGAMAISVVDNATGTVEASTSFTIDSNVSGYGTPQVITLPGMLSTGLKTMTLSFSNTAGGYICNYQDVSLARMTSVPALVSSVSIADQTVVEGTSTDWACTLPRDYSASTVTFSIASSNATLQVTAQDIEGVNFSVTDQGNGTYSIPTPAGNTTTTVTIALTATNGATAAQNAYTLSITKLGAPLITALTIDKEAAAQTIIDALNGDNHTAAISGNIYTAVPTVEATFNDGTTATGTVSVNGTTATCTFANNDGQDYTLTLQDVHIYNKVEGDETVELKYTTSGFTKPGTWTNGLYSVETTSLDGWNNSSFKFNAASNTLSLPTDVIVKQIIFKDFNCNYDPSDPSKLTSVTSEGATATIPTKCNYQEPDATMYDLVVNIANHKAGTPITFTIEGGGQPVAWLELTIAKEVLTTAPTVISQSITPTTNANHCVVALTFDREMQDATASIDGKSVTAKGGSSTLYFSIWDCNYNTNYTLTLPTGSLKDTYGNSNTEAINVPISFGSEPVATKAAYDYVVSTAAEFSAAIAGVNASNKPADAARKTIFIKNGDYDFGSTEQKIEANNVSLIGESRDGVILHGNRNGISNPVLNIRDHSGFYLQDLTVRNDYDYRSGEFRNVAVAIYGGNKTVMKNVRMLSNQDTQVTGERAYMENCEIHGTVDFICGGGVNYYYMTDLVLENRGGNCITAPATNAGLDFGYVFESCTIKAAEGAESTVDGNYSLGRPWQNEPRCTYLNTVMEVLPTDAGWARMSDLPTHFYEYNSLTADNDKVDVSKRENSPSSTNSYSPVLSETEAAQYTLQNVLGGTDSWLPTEQTAQCAAPTITLSDGTISWTDDAKASSYVVLRNGSYYDNVTVATYDITEGGTYSVRAANAMGGLGEASNEVEVAGVVATGTTGWATACLNSDAKVPAGAKAYYISSANNNTVVLSELIEVPAGEGFILNAVQGTHEFEPATSVAPLADNLLVGTTADVNVDANSVYVLAPIGETGSVGMQLYTGTTIPSGKAYLPMSQQANAKTLTIVFGETTGISQIEAATSKDAAIYNLAGQRISRPAKGLYIMNGRKVVVK